MDSEAQRLISRLIRRGVRGTGAYLQDPTRGPEILQRLHVYSELHPDTSSVPDTAYPAPAPEVVKEAKGRESYPVHYMTKVKDLRIAIENRRGSKRRGVDPDGKSWETEMKHPYGEILGTVGTDGDPVDCFIGPDKSSDFVLVVHLKKKGTKSTHDEDKVILGCKSRDEAFKIFTQHYNNWREFYLSDTPMTIYDLQKKLERRGKKAVKLASDAAANAVGAGVGGMGGAFAGSYGLAMLAHKLRLGRAANAAGAIGGALVGGAGGALLGQKLYNSTYDTELTPQEMIGAALGATAGTGALAASTGDGMGFLLAPAVAAVGAAAGSGLGKVVSEKTASQLDIAWEALTKSADAEEFEEQLYDKGLLSDPMRAREFVQENLGVDSLSDLDPEEMEDAQQLLGEVKVSEAQKTIAVDFDSTLSLPTGEPVNGARDAMLKFKDAGYRVIVFTVRGDKGPVEEFMAKYDIPYDFINENPDQPEGASGKVIAHHYIDDRAVPFNGDWDSVSDDVVSGIPHWLDKVAELKPRHLMGAEAASSEKEFIKSIRDGDIIVTKPKEEVYPIHKRLTNIGIQIGTNSPWTHTSMCVGKGDVVHGTPFKIPRRGDSGEAAARKSTVESVLADRDALLLRPKVSDKEKSKAISRVKDLIGVDYPSWMSNVVGAFIPQKRSDKDDAFTVLHCSGIIAHAYHDMDFRKGKSRNAVRPGDLAKSDDTEVIVGLGKVASISKESEYDVIAHCPDCQGILHDGPRYHTHCDDCGYDVAWQDKQERRAGEEWADIPEDDPRMVVWNTRQKKTRDRMRDMGFSVDEPTAGTKLNCPICGGLSQAQTGESFTCENNHTVESKHASKGFAKNINLSMRWRRQDLDQQDNIMRDLYVYEIPEKTASVRADDGCYDL